uniref:putative uncharacterized protein DDB_G0294196 n=1 Tax=Osmia lignaria TaxID=473952 RepID=UPI0014787BCC|nr:putative uncharacterized protein DDB_G0294196 [Osmia lignaria]
MTDMNVETNEQNEIMNALLQLQQQLQHMQTRQQERDREVAALQQQLQQQQMLQQQQPPQQQQTPQQQPQHQQPPQHPDETEADVKPRRKRGTAAGVTRRQNRGRWPRGGRGGGRGYRRLN